MRIFWFRIIPSLLLLSACHKDPEIFGIHNLEGNKILAFGHGGMGIRSLLPIDSYESLSTALSLASDGTEMDLQLSKDSVLFLYHARDLEESTLCAGALNKKSSDEIDCEYKSIFHKGIKVSRLEYFLERLPADTTLILTFECKLDQLDSDQWPTFINALENTIVKYRLRKRVFIESTFPEFLALLKERDSELKLFLYHNSFDYALNMADSLKIFGLTFNMNIVTAAQVQLAHARGLRVTLFNQQKDQENITAIQMNPDFMQTDRLDHLTKILKNRVGH